MRRAGLLLLLVGCVAARPVEQPAAQDQPALVVALVVDQMRGDYLERFGPQFTGGLARLVREGAVFPSAYQDHGMTETAPGHASVLSGRYPASTGIIRNSAGVPDTSSPLVGIPGPGASPRRFRGTALFDWLQARWSGARALSVGGKDRGAILPIGHSRQQVYWLTASRYYTTSRYYADTLPTWVRVFNSRVTAARAPGRVWDLLLPPSAYPETDSVPWENRGRDVAFPHIAPGDEAGASRAFEYSPWSDSTTLALALRGVEELRLGRGRATDLLAVSLSGLDHVGHTFGPDSREVHDHVLRLDRLLGVFLDSLQRLAGPRPLLLVLTADHGVTPFPEAAWARGDSAPRNVVLDTLLTRWRDDLDDALGEGRYILWRTDGLIGMNRSALVARGVRMDTLLARMVADIGTIRGVARVQTRADLARDADTTRDAVTRRWRRAFSEGDAAELFVSLSPGSVLSGGGTTAQHGLPTDTDAHVALVLWGPGIRPGRYEGRVAVVDIAPTLAHLLGIEPAERLDGRVLAEALGPRSSVP